MMGANVLAVLIASFCCFQLISAHTSLGMFIQNGQASDACVRPRNPNYFSYPLQSIGWFHGLHDQNLTCGYMPEAGGAAQSVCSVTAGETVGAGWANPSEPDTYPIIIEEHKGIYQAYMTPFNHGSGGLPSGNVWFKIAAGSSDGGQWVVPYSLYNNAGTGTMNGRSAKYGGQFFQIPADIPDGDYLIRPEVLTFQECTGATDSTCAQHYIGCIQVRVTGGGNGKPTDLASFPGTYNEQTPGLHFVLWGDSSDSYVSKSGYPGPAVYVAGSNPTPTPTPQPPAPAPQPPAPVNPPPAPVPPSAGIIDFEWHTDGSQSGSCVKVFETLDAHSWDNNYLCGTNEALSGWVYSSYNAVPGDYNCVQWFEGSDWDSWGDNFLCIPKSDPRNYAFSCAGPIPGMTCISVNEPTDPDTWADNYWCTSTTAQGANVNVGANGLYNVSSNDGASQDNAVNSSSFVQVSFALVALLVMLF